MGRSARRRKDNGVIYMRRHARKRIRAATRAVLRGGRNPISHVGPNWKSGKFKREVPDDDGT